jgi:NAD(P)-dependent dehydrogenase (short-subunit alcohol dehydrogenase family)
VTPARRIVVTGATEGIGWQTALELMRLGHDVVVHGRSEARAAEAAAKLAKASGKPAPETCVADLASMKQVRAMGAALLERFDRIDVLVNNAGVFATKRIETEDGFELTIAINHLSHFLLTHLLLPALRQSDQGRVVHVASGVHAGGRVDLGDLQMRERWDGYEAYASSKLMNVLFSNELARRLHDTHITSNSLHPGVIATKLLRAGFGGGGASLEKGARTSVRVATDPALAGVTGAYFSDEREVASSARSRDPALAEGLYELSCKLTGVSPLPE